MTDNFGFQAIFERALDPMLIADDRAQYVDANPAACAFLQLSRTEICSRSVVDFTPPEGRGHFEAAWRAFLEAGHQRGEYRLQLDSGTITYVEFSATANVLPGQHLSILRDISDRKRLEAEREDLMTQVQALAMTDPLTELGNRRAWHQRLEEELARARRSEEPVMIAVLDLDDFKAVNDTHGHAAGDQVLRAIATEWQAQLRESDFLARIGGDEFCLLLPNCSDADADAILRRLESVTPTSQDFSTGLATWDGVEDAATLFARADRALYRQKTLT